MVNEPSHGFHPAAYERMTATETRPARNAHTGWLVWLLLTAAGLPSCLTYQVWKDHEWNAVTTRHAEALCQIEGASLGLGRDRCHPVLAVSGRPLRMVTTDTPPAWSWPDGQAVHLLLAPPAVGSNLTPFLIAPNAAVGDWQASAWDLAVRSRGPADRAPSSGFHATVTLTGATPILTDHDAPDRYRELSPAGPIHGPEAALTRLTRTFTHRLTTDVDFLSRAVWRPVGWIDRSGRRLPPAALKRMLEILDLRHDVLTDPADSGVRWLVRLDQENGTTAFLAVPPAVLVAVDRLRFHQRGQAIRWSIQEDWSVRRIDRAPSGAGFEPWPLPLERPLYSLKHEEIHSRPAIGSTAIRSLLTGPALAVDLSTLVIWIWIKSSVFPDDDEDPVEEELRRTGRQ